MCVCVNELPLVCKCVYVSLFTDLIFVHMRVKGILPLLEMHK